MFAEQLELIQRQWTEDEVGFDGRRYRTDRLRALPRPVQNPRPRLIVRGSARPGTVVPAVRFADEYNTIYVSPQEAAARRSRLDGACRETGRDPATLTLSLMTGAACLAATRQSCASAAQGVIERMGHEGEPAAFVREHGDTWILGTVDQARKRLDKYAHAGVERVMLRHPDHTDLDAVRLMADLG